MTCEKRGRTYWVGIADYLRNVDEVISALAYGSWYYDETSVDVDIAIIVPSSSGIVDRSVYISLKKHREMLVSKWKCDIDLVPHTQDEVEDIGSPLWYPRYNPSLVFGNSLKGNFYLRSTTDDQTKFDFKDLAGYVLYDNRTICRRQLIRSLEGESGRIYVSKLLHGIGNALTYNSCLLRKNYYCSPSNIRLAQKLFDNVYGVNSLPAEPFLLSCKKGLNFQKALSLMTWYENVVNLVLKGDEFKGSYEEICKSLTY